MSDILLTLLDPAGTPPTRANTGAATQNGDDLPGFSFGHLIESDEAVPTDGTDVINGGGSREFAPGEHSDVHPKANSLQLVPKAGQHLSDASLRVPAQAQPKDSGTDTRATETPEKASGLKVLTAPEVETGDTVQNGTDNGQGQAPADLGVQGFALTQVSSLTTLSNEVPKPAYGAETQSVSKGPSVNADGPTGEIPERTRPVPLVRDVPSANPNDASSPPSEVSSKDTASLPETSPEVPNPSTQADYPKPDVAPSERGAGQAKETEPYVAEHLLSALGSDRHEVETPDTQTPRASVQADASEPRNIEQTLGPKERLEQPVPPSVLPGSTSTKPAEPTALETEPSTASLLSQDTPYDPAVALDTQQGDGLHHEQAAPKPESHKTATSHPDAVPYPIRSATIQTDNSIPADQGRASVEGHPETRAPREIYRDSDGTRRDATSPSHARPDRLVPGPETPILAPEAPRSAQSRDTVTTQVLDGYPVRASDQGGAQDRLLKANDGVSSSHAPRIDRETNAANAPGAPAISAPKASEYMTPADPMLGDLPMPEQPLAERGRDTPLIEPARREVIGHAPPPTETVRPAAVSISETLKLGTGTFEVSLSPEELGKVTVSVNADEGRLTVLVTAERPETLDLLRRSMDVLREEATRAGFSDLDLSFSDAKDDARQNDWQQTPPTTDPDPLNIPQQAPLADAAIAASPPSSDRLDIRL